jgi:hypothetical protein
MGIIKVPVRVCDFDTTKEQEESQDNNVILIPCTRCDKDLCRKHRVSIDTTGYISPLAYSSAELCPSCLKGFAELMKDFLGIPKQGSRPATPEELENYEQLGKAYEKFYRNNKKGD